MTEIKTRIRKAFRAQASAKQLTNQPINQSFVPCPIINKISLKPALNFSSYFFQTVTEISSLAVVKRMASTLEPNHFYRP